MAEVAGAVYFLPVVAAFLGAIEGAAAWGALQLFGAAAAAALIIALALLLTGFHHADGLADVADAVMAGGGVTRRLAVLKDRTTGVGAVATLILVLLVSWAALLEILPSLEASTLPWVMMSVEVSSRFCLLAAGIFSRASHTGTGSAFLEALKGGKGAVAIGVSVLFLAALALPLGFEIPLACAVSALTLGLALAGAGKIWFGGANGDLLGASAELGRMAALLAAAAVIIA